MQLKIPCSKYIGNFFIPKVFFHHLTNLRPSMSPIKELKGPVGQIQYADRIVYAVEQNKVKFQELSDVNILKFLLLNR